MAEIPPRPEPLIVNFDQIPGALTYPNQWVLWRYEWVDGKNGKPGKWDKPPLQPTGKFASSTAKLTWSTFAIVRETYERGLNLPVDDPLHFSGVGFVPAKVSQADNNLQFGDLDKCRDKESGVITAEAAQDLQSVNSYCEISPSGTGIRFIAMGHLPYPHGRDGCKKGHFELYQGRHYLTITGHRLLEYPVTVEKRPDELNVFYAKHFGEPETAQAHAPVTAGTADSPKWTDDQIICLASEARNAAKFMALMAGNIDGYSSQSEADQALLNKLAFWTGKDATQMDRLFRQSKLMRLKWDEKRGTTTYGEMTIQKAIDGTRDVYKPRHEQPNGYSVLEYEDCFKTEQKEKNGELVLNPTTGEPEEETHFSADHTKKSIEKKFDLVMVRGDDKTIWRFDGHIYSNNGRPFFRNAIYDVASDAIDPRNVNEVLDRLTSSLMIRPVTFNPNPFLFPAIDGVLDLKTGEMRDGTPSDLMTFQYNAHHHHPDADYDQFLFYLASSLPDLRDCLTAIDLYTKAVIRVPFDTFAFLLGGGENGKGIFEKVLIKLLGMERVSASKIDEFKKSHFAAGNLLNKDAWVITEVETIKEAMSVIKAVSSGEMLDSDVKYATDRARGTPHLLPIIDSNKALDFKDPSWGRKRRTLKLDFPYEFGYKPDCRPKDPHLLDKLTSPESLAGILQLIKARAPSLIAARKIYRRKSSEEQEAELDRQRFSLQYFCNDCLVKEADWPEKIDPLDETTKPPRLTTDRAFELYREYCKLWNVPEPAEKVPLGRYISEKFRVESAVGSTTIDGKKKSYRFYSGLFCSKSPVTAHAEIYVEYSEILHRTTDILQMWIGEKDISNENTTDPTDKPVILDAIEKLDKMYKFVQSCQNPREISYECFKAVLSVGSVGFQKNGSKDGENLSYGCPTDAKSSVVSGSPDNGLQMNRVQTTVPSTSLPTPSDVDVKASSFEIEPPYGIGPNPRKDAPMQPTKKQVVCAKCGWDLTGRGQVEKNGKVYCCKVGCGYPPREEAKAN